MSDQGELNAWHDACPKLIRSDCSAGISLHNNRGGYAKSGFSGLKAVVAGPTPPLPGLVTRPPARAIVPGVFL